MHRVVVAVAALLLFAVHTQAQAHPRSHFQPHRSLHRLAHLPRTMVMMASSDERIVGSRPGGCPNAFCGCEASLYKFGRIIPELNLASNWRRFPRAAPSPGMAAVRSGHIMILQQQVAGDVWMVHDGNSGGHATREHPRSIAGYTIVDPGAASSGPGFGGFTQTTSSDAWQTRRIAHRRIARGFSS